MKYGMNLLLWTGDIDDSHLPVLESLKTMGFDAVELPMFAPDDQKFTALGKQLDDLGLERTAVTIRNAEDNPISPDAAVRAKGIEANKRTIDSCAAAGCTKLVGPFHSAIGVFSGAGPTEDEWKWGVDSMRAAAEHAQQAGVILCVECLNRFETYLLTCHADSARFVREVNIPACRMMYDTFHANIEANNILAAHAGCKDVLDPV
ncbi:MAG: sugar phosphate isomerase/epimerase, partial [Planctomycetales bacterium]|nr:sugar phosphate isomerase/epimerase [Planctomycetales bacterium]